jgi:hypothetical protein
LDASDYFWVCLRLDCVSDQESQHFDVHFWGKWASGEGGPLGYETGTIQLFDPGETAFEIVYLHGSGAMHALVGREVQSISAGQ